MLHVASCQLEFRSALLPQSTEPLLWVDPPYASFLFSSNHVLPVLPAPADFIPPLLSHLASTLVRHLSYEGLEPTKSRPSHPKCGAVTNSLRSSYGARCTKYVPSPGRMTREVVEAAIKRSCHRMQVNSLDMLQFHW